MLKIVSIAGLALMGFLIVPARSDEEHQRVDLGSLPAAAKEAADKAVPGAKWEKASEETEKGKTVYEIEGYDAQGRDVEVEVTADGKVLQVETEIAMSKVPGVVTDALQAKLPKFKPEGVKSIAKEGKVVSYEFEGDDEKGKEIEVYVDADGKTVKVEEGDD
jgi:uncharacterized membrane protein YkoI